MNEGVAPTWATRELPLLRVALRRLDAGEQYIDLEEIRQEVGLPADQVWTAVHALSGADPPYIDVMLLGGWTENRAGGKIKGVSERTRPELGSWPSAENLVEQLAEALSEAANQEQEPERGGRLMAAADALRSFARDVAVGVLSDRLGRL